MATKKNYLKKNKDSVFNLVLLFVLFLLLSLIIPAIGAGPSASPTWISVVDFFESIKVHFAAFWMFYSFACLVLFAYFGNFKK